MLCQEKFFEIYGKDAAQLAFAPYRICPIGAHTDHNLGKITGLAIDQGIWLAYSPNRDGGVEMASLQFPDGAQWRADPGKTESEESVQPGKFPGSDRAHGRTSVFQSEAGEAERQKDG